MNENEFWLGLWKVIVGGVVLLALTIAGCDSYQTKKFIEKGYTRTMLPGSQTSTWVK